jgi:hypothetical protein
MIFFVVNFSLYCKILRKEWGGKKNVLLANHSPLLRNLKIEKEKTNAETILSSVKIVVCEIEADKVNKTLF